MESGIVKLFPAFTGSKETTAEEMKAYVKTGVDLFCSLSGLVILESKTINHAHGVIYLLGTEGSEQAIMAMGNMGHELNFYISIFYSLIGPDNKIEYNYMDSYMGSGGTGNGLRIDGDNCYIKYIKTSKNFIFGLKEGATAPTFEIYNSITNYKIMETENRCLFYISNTTTCMSYDPMIGNDRSRNLFAAPDSSNAPYIKKNAEGILNIYIDSEGELPYIKLFTNKMQLGAGTIFSAENKRYFVMLKTSGKYSIIAEIE